MVREINSKQPWYDEGIVGLLTEAGLAHHIQTFLDERIDLTIVGKLTDENLKELDLPIGDRHRLWAAVAALDTAPQDAGKSDASRVNFDAERRQLTVLFSDLVGSTQLLRRLDPEDYRELLAEYRSALNKAFAAHDGHIIHFAGDGVVAVFGFPRAHDDDAHRGVRAALDIVASVPAIRIPGTNEALGLRVGIASGTCIVGDIVSEGRSERDGIVGEAINLAARIQTHAHVNGVVVCPVTRSIVGDAFDMVSAGAHEAKGFADQVSTWHVARAEPLLAAASNAPFFGDRKALETLTQTWTSSKSGRMQAHVISGQGGAGKTRLVAAFREQIDVEPRQTIVWSGAQLFENTALHAVSTWLRDELDIARSASNAEALQALAQFRTGDTFAPELKQNILGQLLGDVRDLPERDLSTTERRQTLLAMCVSHLRVRAQRSPILLVVEDLHWIDPTTLELIRALRQELEACAIMLVATTRAAADAIPGGIGTPLALSPLDEASAAALIEDTAEGVTLTPEAIATIIRRSEGVPLYLVEITRLVVQDQRSGGDIEIPATIRGALTARFDALEEDRELALVCAVLGRAFEADLLPELTGNTAEEVEAALTRLAGRKILERAQTAEITAETSEATTAWRFSHALIQEAAYDCVLKRQRVELHKTVVALYASLRPDLMTREPERMAYHYRNAQDHHAAAQAWYLASQNALTNSAHSEALTHLGQGIAEMTRVDTSQERKAMELKLYSARGRTLISVEGHGSPNVLEALKHAARLTEEVDSAADLFPVVWGLNAYHMIRGNVEANVKASARLVDFADEDQDHEHIVVAHTSRALALYYAGRFEEALRHVRVMEQHYDSETDPDLAHKYAVDRLVVGYQHGSWLLWLLGRADDAARMERKLYAHVNANPHPYSYAQALTSGASVYVLRREPQTMLERAEGGIAFARKKGKEVWVDHGDFWIGWARAEMGDPQAGGQLIERALERYLASGTGSSLPKFYAMMAENRMQTGDISAAEACIEKALDRIQSFGERCYVAECRRIEAMIALHRGDSARARGILENAIEIAQFQKALGWELRLSRDLGRLLAESGARGEAEALLGRIVDRVPQGHSLADYRETRALLDAL